MMMMPQRFLATTQPETKSKRLTLLSDDPASMDEKKSECGSPVSISHTQSASSQTSKTWNEGMDVSSIGIGDNDAAPNIERTQEHRFSSSTASSLNPPPTNSLGNSPYRRGSPRNHEPSRSGSSSSSLGNNNNSSNNSAGLHHRHHHNQQQQHNPASFGSQSPRSSNQHPIQHMSPTRRRRNEKLRKRKWTLVQIVRILLMAGIFVYFFMIIRVIRHSDTLEGDNDTLRGRLHSLLNSEKEILLGGGGDEQHGYLRSNAVPLPFLGQDFIRKKPLEDASALQRRLEKRTKDRKSRTRPPNLVLADSISEYQILSMDQYEREPSPNLNGGTTQDTRSLTLADATQLCGMNTQEASKRNPQYFLQQNALNSNSKVLITGILSNPVAFHLALTLKAYCGVEVMVGIDPMMPNTITNRLKLIEQMKILSTNAPRMIQPILVPLLGLDPRVKKSNKRDSPSSEQPFMLSTTGELNLLNFKPTHIVHLSTAAPERQVAEQPPPDTFYMPKRPLSPYQTGEEDHYEPSLFQIRSGMTAMEQILASIVSCSEYGQSPPHLTYASTTRDHYEPPTVEHKVHANTKLMDEVLADTYHAIYGVNSVGVRFPPNAIYGPWDHPGADIYQMLEGALQGNFSMYKTSTPQEMLYVQDAVDAILTAMQFKPNSATAFDLKTNSPVSLSEVSSMVQSSLGAANSISVADRRVALQQNSHTMQNLAWYPRTTLRDGILRSLAWHIDRALPYGPPPNPDSKDPQLQALAPTSGDALLLRNAVPTCAADDLACHSGSKYLPCISECSVKAQCKASIFDPVRDLSRNMTEGCDAVLYTQSLGRNIEDLKLQSQFEDDVEPVICNLAFVAQSSPLVRAVIDKIPPEELTRLGVPEASAFEDKVQKLNGRLLYRGWILIWVESGGSMSPADSSLLKLSPSRMFSRDALYAVFVEENFSVSPTTDDVRFLIGQMDRGATHQRSIYRWVKSDEKSKPKKAKFTIPAAPEKRASILVSQLKYKISEKSRIPQNTKISIMDAVRFMRFEIGSDPTKQKESSAIRRQKEFYRRLPSFVNSRDLRDSMAPLYKYDMNHWVRTRWVVHDLRLEESRQIRCDWYQEHVQWGSEIDQLSFAAIMAQREVERRVAHWEPDDRMKSKQSETPAAVKDVTDFNEWFAMDTEQNKLQYLEVQQSAEVEQIPDHIVRDALDEDGAEEEAADSLSAEPAEKKTETGLYVRIISDRIMSLSRKAWQKYRESVGSAA